MDIDEEKIKALAETKQRVEMQELLTLGLSRPGGAARSFKAIWVSEHKQKVLNMEKKNRIYGSKSRRTL